MDRDDNLRGSRVGLEKDKNYLSHSPQPYSKFKLQPTKSNLMIYGQNAANGKPGGSDVYLEADARTLNTKV